MVTMETISKQLADKVHELSPWKPFPLHNVNVAQQPLPWKLFPSNTVLNSS